MELLELNAFLVSVVQTQQKVGTSVSSSRNYENVPLVRKPL